MRLAAERKPKHANPVHQGTNRHRQAALDGGTFLGVGTGSISWLGVSHPFRCPIRIEPCGRGAVAPGSNRGAQSVWLQAPAAGLGQGVWAVFWVVLGRVPCCLVVSRSISIQECRSLRKACPSAVTVSVNHTTRRVKSWSRSRVADDWCVQRTQPPLVPQARARFDHHRSVTFRTHLLSFFFLNDCIHPRSRCNNANPILSRIDRPALAHTMRPPPISQMNQSLEVCSVRNCGGRFCKKASRPSFPSWLR